MTLCDFRVIYITMKRVREIEKIEIPSNKVIKFRKKVAAYCRVSLETEKLNNSLANQITYYKNYITSKKGYDFVKVYYDKGISGTNTKKREAFNEMISDAKAGKIDLILTKSISRFARNTVDLLNTVRELKAINVEVKFEKENISSLSADGELMLSILASFSQSESESISQNVKWARRKKFEQGLDQYRPMFAFGYEGGKYIIIEKEAKVVRQVFRLFNDGLTYTEIAGILNKGNVKTRNNRDWSQCSIKDMLRNEKYMGDSLFQKKYVANTLTHYTKRNNGELPQYYAVGTHPAIVSKSEFEKAQERIKYITEHKVECHKQSKWFTGLVKCPVCGRSFIKVNNETLSCIGHGKYKTCGNLARLRIKDLEKVLKGKNVNKIDHIILAKTRFNGGLRKGHKFGDNFKFDKYEKGDFVIIWKQ